MCWKGYERKRPWPNIRHYSGICLWVLRKIIEVCQDSCFPAETWTPGLPETEGCVITRPRHSLAKLFLCLNTTSWRRKDASFRTLWSRPKVEQSDHIYAVTTPSPSEEAPSRYRLDVPHSCPYLPWGGAHLGGLGVVGRLPTLNVLTVFLSLTVRYDRFLTIHHA